MMASELRWHGDAIKTQIESQTRRRLSACAFLLVNHAKKLISVDGTGVAASAWKRSTKELVVNTTKSGAWKSGFKWKTTTRRKKAGRLIYGANPSAPGEPPHVQTGRLRGSVAWELVGLIARVGTNVHYGKDLEFGTKKMAPRPWLRRSLLECLAAISKILSAPMSFRKGA